MRVAIGSDHAGFELKEKLISYFLEKGYEVDNFGTYSLDSCHYPEFGKKVGEAVASNKSDFGVLICSTGEGISIAANKVEGVRCGIAYNDDVAHFIKAHNNANVIAFGAKYVTLEEAIKRIEIYLSTEFEGGRHQTRVNML